MARINLRPIKISDEPTPREIADALRALNDNIRRLNEAGRDIEQRIQAAADEARAGLFLSD